MKILKFTKVLTEIRFKSLLLTPLLVAMVAIPTISVAAEPRVKVGTTYNFAVLAGTTITNTGTTSINGSVGLFPGTAFTGQESASVNGDVQLANAAALKAKNDLITTYNDAYERKNVTHIPTELGGTTLTPGTYDSASGTFEITGNLTLDAQGDPNAVFIFKTASTLVTASGSSVTPINNAQLGQTFWKVGSSATLGTNSYIVGNIVALTSITANTGAKVRGQLLARNGAVTLDANTITNGIGANTVVPKTIVAAESRVKVGSSYYFAVLAGTTITNTGTTSINGNVGLFPGTAFTGQESASVNGDMQLANASALKAKNDLITAYNDADGRKNVKRIPTELGGAKLTPGTYDSASGTFEITGNLTLDAQGNPNAVFIFKTASTLVTAAGSSVTPINNAQLGQTFWKVGSSATLGTNSNIVGDIVALTSITANTGAKVRGQLLARNGAVTLDTNAITK